MHILTEQQKKAIPAVLECGIHESVEEALQAAIFAIESALGIDSQESRRMMETLQDLEFVETHIRRWCDVGKLPFIVIWRLTEMGHEDLRSEANAWVESQFKSECEALGVDRNSVSWVEPGRDVLPLTGLEIARIAAGDPGYCEDPDYRAQIGAQAWQAIKNKKVRGQLRYTFAEAALCPVPRGDKPHLVCTKRKT